MKPKGIGKNYRNQWLPNFSIKNVYFSIDYLTAELGDFDPEVHTPGFISEFRFIPDQTEEIELAIFEAFKTMT